jgi:hypothetical protein
VDEPPSIGTRVAGTVPSYRVRVASPLLVIWPGVASHNDEPARQTE